MDKIIGKIEKGHEVPDARTFRKSKSAVRIQIELMDIGDSFTFSAESKEALEKRRRPISGLCSTLGKKMKRRYVMRQIEDLTIRVYRVK